MAQAVVLTFCIARSDKPYQVDHVFDEASTQVEIYERAASSYVDAALKVHIMTLSLVRRTYVLCHFQGINATIFAYGQTGTGKTFTIGELPDVGVLFIRVREILYID